MALPDFDVAVKFADNRVDARIEIPDRHSGAEPERLRPTLSGPHHQGTIDEVDGDVERRALMMEAACRQARTSTYSGTFHQWLRGAVVASRILPRIWLYKCSVSFVARQSARCSSGQGHGLVTTNATLSR